jgi:hypothetical protein
VISVAPPGAAVRVPVDVVIAQTGTSTIEVATSGGRYDAEVEFFRAENRYTSRESSALDSELELVD